MSISKDKIGALIFFIFSTCYGYYAFQIPLYPGEEYEVFTSQTMPKLYAIAGMSIAGLALLMSILAGATTLKHDCQHSGRTVAKKGCQTPVSSWATYDLN